MKTTIKDPKKVEAGRKGGRLSPSNFKRNKRGATIAAMRRQWSRGEALLADYPLGLLDDMGKEISFPDEHAQKRRK